MMLKNSTRRTMTEQRIQNNIRKCNDPGTQNKFHDIMVNQSYSSGKIHFAYRQVNSSKNNTRQGKRASHYSTQKDITRSMRSHISEVTSEQKGNKMQ